MSRSVHEKWVERARYDLETAEVLLAAGRYIYVVFMCQQAIEKCFKAVISYRSLEDIQELARQLGEDTARECVRFARGKMAWCIHELTR